MDEQEDGGHISRSKFATCTCEQELCSLLKSQTFDDLYSRSVVDKIHTKRNFIVTVVSMKSQISRTC